MKPTLIEIVRKVLYDCGIEDPIEADIIAQRVNEDYNQFHRVESEKGPSPAGTDGVKE